MKQPPNSLDPAKGACYDVQQDSVASVCAQLGRCSSSSGSTIAMQRYAQLGFGEGTRAERIMYILRKRLAEYTSLRTSSLQCKVSAFSFVQLLAYACPVKVSLESDEPF